MRSYLAGATFTFAIVLFAATAHAATKQFTIDPAQSSLTIAPSTSLFGFLSFPSAPQGDGAYTASYSGTIDADVTATTIQLLGTSNLVAGISGAWKPGDDYSNYPADALSPTGYPNTTVDANYGIFTDFSAGSSFGLPPSSLTAIRDLEFSFFDALPKPLAGGTFAEVGTETGITSGTAYYSVGAAPPITDLTLGAPVIDSSALADTAGTGTLTKSGFVYTLSIPVSFTVAYNAFLDIATTYSGTIVATAVPEPASAAIVAAALAVGACFVRRR